MIVLHQLLLPVTKNRCLLPPNDNFCVFHIVQMSWEIEVSVMKMRGNFREGKRQRSSLPIITQSLDT